MYKTLHKIITLGLLFLMAAPAILFTGFWIKQKIIQHQMLEQLEVKALQTITENTIAVKWIKKDKEVEIQGRMFDVKHFEIHDGKITLTGLYDAEEQQLKKDVVRLMEQDSGEETPITTLILKLIFSEAYNNSTGFTVASTDDANQMNFNFYTEIAQSRYKAVHTPPPNV